MGTVDGIAAAFIKLKVTAEKVGPGTEEYRDQAFQEIFALNNEIGRLAHQSPKTMPKMKELQAYVNLITVGLKYDKPESVREGLTLTAERIELLKTEL